MNQQKERLLTAFEQQLGLQVTYQSLSPNILAALEFRDVRGYAANGETVFKASSVLIRWNWGVVLSGQFEKLFEKVQIINATVDLNATRDQDLLERLQTLLASSSTGSTSAVQFEGFNVAVNWSSPSEALQLQRGFFQFSRLDRDFRLAFRSEGSGRLFTASSLLKNFQGQFEGELRTNASFTTFSARARTSRVNTNLFTLANLHVQLKANPDEIELVKVQDSLPFDFRLHRDTARGQTQLSLTAERFQPTTLITWKGSDLISRLLTTNLTGQFGVEVSDDLKVWSAFADGEAGLPSGLQDKGLLQGASVVRGKIEATPRMLTFEQASFESDPLSVAFDGSLDLITLLPEGHLELARYEEAGLGLFSGTADFVRTDNLASFVSPRLQWDSLVLDSVSGWVEHSGDLLATSVELATGQPGEQRTVVKLATSGSLATKIFPLSFQIANLPLARLNEQLSAHGIVLGLPELLQNLLVQAKGSLTLGPSAFDLQNLEVGFSDPAVAGREGSFSSDFQAGQLRIINGAFEWDGLAWTADLQADLTTSELISWQLQAGFLQQRFTATGLYSVPQNRLSFTGSKGLAGEFQLSDADNWTARLKLDEFIPLPGYLTAFDVAASMQAGLFQVELNNVSVESVYPWNQEKFRFIVAGQASLEAVTLRSVVLQDSHNRLTGALSSSWGLDFAKPWLGSLSLAGDDATDAVGLTWNISSLEKAQASLTTSRLDLRRWLPAPFQGRLNAKATLDWSPQATGWTIAATVAEARWGESPLGLKFNGKGTLRQASLTQVQFSLDPVSVADGSLDINLDTRAWTGTLPLNFRFGPTRWTSRLATAGTWTGDGLPTSVSTVLDARQVTLGGAKQDDWSLTGGFDGNKWNASLTNGSLNARGDTAGALFVQLKSPFPVQGTATGTFIGGQIELKLADAKADLTLLRDLTDRRLLDLKAGTLAGDFQLSGLLGDPAIKGTGRLVEGVFVTDFIRQTVGPVTVPFEFLGRSVRIPKTNIGPPGQSWMVSGDATLDHFLPQEYLFTVETEGTSQIPFAYQGEGIAARGLTSGAMTFRGNTVSLLVGGRMLVQDSVITIGKDPKYGAGGDYYGVNADLTFVTGRNVEYVAPNETLPLLRAITSTNQTITIHWNEALNEFDMRGNLALKAGEINYLNQTFVLKEGSLVFQEDENAFDPRVFLRAQIRKWQEKGPVTVTLQVDGPLSKFEPRFSAIPYRSPEDLQQLIGATLAPTAASTLDLSAALALASDVGTGFVLKPFEESVKRNLGLDLFTVKTEILKKSLSSQNDSLDASGYLDNTRLFFGKYIGDDVFLAGTLAFRQDSAAALLGTQPLLVEPEISMDFQTPFFLLNWTLQPQNADTLFVADNTVTFSWNWSY